MQELASIKTFSHPTGSAIVLNDFYIDDLLSGANIAAELMKIRDEIREVLKEREFQLRKWASNHAKVLKDMGQIGIHDSIYFINKHEEICTLGMR